MKKDSKYGWYLIDIIVFLLINVIILGYFTPNLGLAFQQITWTTIVILALGIYRLTDVITQESVTEIFRAPFMDKKMIEENGVMREVWEISDYGFRGFFGTLLSCNACLGVWVSMAVFYCFLFFPNPTLVFMIIMTLTCFERFLSKIYNFLEKRG